MFSLLCRLFITDYENYDNVEVRRKYGILGSLFGIILNVVLFSLKYFAGFISGSVAIMADAFNNLSDAGSSIITLVGFKFTGMKPDNEHPFGHGRVEYIAGLIVSIAIILMGFELLKSSIEKIFKSVSVETSTIAFVILIVSIFIKLYMAFYNKNISEKIKSAAMKATAIDSLSDAIATTVVFVSMVVTKFTGYKIDGYCGAVVAVFILFAGYGAAKDTISPLLGTKPAPETVNEIKEIVISHSGVLGIHDLMVHDYGPGRMIISLHAEVSGDGDIYEIHSMIDDIENELNERFNCESVIHMDPVDTGNEKARIMYSEISEMVKKIDERFSIHDFRIVSCKTYYNIIFDMIVPPKYNESDKEIKEKVAMMISEIYPGYHAIIKIDKSYI